MKKSKSLNFHPKSKCIKVEKAKKLNNQENFDFCEESDNFSVNFNFESKTTFDLISSAQVFIKIILIFNKNNY